MTVATFPDWTFDFYETQRYWYNINAFRSTGNVIGIDGTYEDSGLKKIVSDIVDFELEQNRTSSYWNSVFEEVFKSNRITFHNDLELLVPNDHFKSWSIKLDNVELHFQSSQPEISLIKNEETLYAKKWNEFNGAEFFKLLDVLKTNNQ